jgi:protein-tyrosine phosphatase
MTFKIVFVCTGNQCRSPAAEAIVRHRTQGLDVTVSSVGTRAVEGVGPDKPIVRALAPMGIDLSAHRTRPLAAEDLSSADLVVGFHRDHAATAVVDGGALPWRTFLLAELAALLSELPPAATSEPEEERARIAAAHELRRQRGASHIEQIADPIGRPAAVVERTVKRIAELCDQVVEGLFGR